MRALIVLLLVFSTTTIALGKLRIQTPEDQLSPSESQEVDQFVRAFNKRLRLTRDLAPFQTEPLASEMLDRLLLDKDGSIPLVSNDLISRKNLRELRQFWIATLNLAYLSELYIYTRMSVDGIRTYELSPAQQYPPNVLRVMERNRILAKSRKQDSDSSKQVAKRIEQLRGLTTTYERAASLLRARFRAHPPEQTGQYQQNIVYLSKYLRVVYVETCNKEEDCYGLPLHTKTITVNIPVLTLVLVRMDGRLKILAIGKIDD